MGLVEPGRLIVKGWIKRQHTVHLTTNSGRSRLNIPGAYSPDTHDLLYLEGRESVDAERVAQLLRTIRAAHPGVPLLLILDNTPYHRAPAVTQAADELAIALRYLPTYSPNLNLIERFWKFLKRTVTRNRYYPTFAESCSAIQNLLTNLPTYRDELTTLLTERVQLLTAP